MKVTNNTGAAVIAVGWHLDHGFGEEVRIEPSAAAEIQGPHLGEMGGPCFIALDGEITVHDGEDDEATFHVSRGRFLALGKGNAKGITVRHHGDSLESTQA